MGGSKRLTTKEFIERAKATHGDKYDYSLVEYTTAKNKVKIICPIHGEFLQIADSHRGGKGCPACGLEKVSKDNRFTQDEFIEKANEVHNFKYSYEKVNYITSKDKIIITCKDHGDFEQAPNSHLQGIGCKKCGYANNANNQRKTTEDFIIKAIKIHSDKYDYSKVEYVNSSTKVTIICPIHGDFQQTPNNHLKGKGCTKCSNLSTGDKLKSSNEDFIKKANEVHNDKYLYNKVDYKGNQSKIIITCPIHGDFEQQPNNHLVGKGCLKCGTITTGEKKKNSLDYFITKANEVHNNKYSYEESKYEDVKTKVTIICPIHGDFQQTPNNHLNGRGCHACGVESHWGRSDYIKKANGKICTFYILKCFNDNEEFYKIGRTKNTVKSRYNTIEKMPYNYEIVSEIYGDAGFIWDLEIQEKRKLKELHYAPLVKFAGSKTECFTNYKL